MVIQTPLYKESSQLYLENNHKAYINQIIHSRYEKECGTVN